MFALEEDVQLVATANTDPDSPPNAPHTQQPRSKAKKTVYKPLNLAAPPSPAKLVEHTAFSSIHSYQNVTLMGQPGCQSRRGVHPACSGWSVNITK